MKDAVTESRSGSANFSAALKVLSNTARVRRFRIFTRTSVWPPRAVGFDTSTSTQTYGAPSNSKKVLRLISIASNSRAMGPHPLSFSGVRSAIRWSHHWTDDDRLRLRADDGETVRLGRQRQRRIVGCHDQRDAGHLLPQQCRREMNRIERSQFGWHGL